MDDRAVRILNRIKNAQSSWDTTKLVDPNATQPMGQPPSAGRTDAGNESCKPLWSHANAAAKS